MFSIYWRKGPSKGWVDLLPSWWLETDGEYASLSHAYFWGARGSDGRKRTAKCSLNVSGSVVAIDYGGKHTADNAPNFNVGVTRLTFDDASRTGMPKVEWCDAGSADFEDVDVDVERREDLSIDELELFDPDSIEDGRRRIERLVTLRQGQPGFRKKLLEAYRRCAVTGCTIEAVLEAAHISPYRGTRTNHVTNGLLLRADIHTLFDLGLLRIHGDYRIKADSHILQALNIDEGQVIKLPSEKAFYPNPKALEQKAKGG